MNNRINRVFKTIQRQYACFLILRHGFWFIDIPRTSSSSIRAELGKHFGFPYGKKDILEQEHSSRRQEIFPSHMTAQKASSAISGFVWRKIFKFTIVRNPWDRVYSLYLFRKKRKRISESLSFRDYVISLHQAFISNKFSQSLFSYPPHRYGSSDFILNSNGEIMVDYIAKYENREHDLKFIASRIGLPELGRLHVQSSTSEIKHYSYFYDSEMKEIIQTIYAKDIDLFNYQFDYRA